MLIYGKEWRSLSASMCMVGYRRSLIANMCMVDYRRSLIASMCVRKHLSKFKIASHAEQHKHMCVVKDRQHLEARDLG